MPLPAGEVVSTGAACPGTPEEGSWLIVKPMLASPWNAGSGAMEPDRQKGCPGCRALKSVGVMVVPCTTPAGVAKPRQVPRSTNAAAGCSGSTGAFGSTTVGGALGSTGAGALLPGAGGAAAPPFTAPLVPP